MFALLTMRPLPSMLSEFSDMDLVESSCTNSRELLHHLIPIWNMWEITDPLPLFYYTAMADLNVADDVFNARQAPVFDYILEG